MSTQPVGANILVVDDDRGILRAVSRILGRRHEVTCVATGDEALREVSRLRPDLAVVDIRLPGMTGFEVTRGLKAALPDVDVILMTGNAEEPDENLIRAIDEGAFYFIQKPFDRRVLLTLVNRCLELRWLRGEREHYLRRVERELEEARRFQLSLLPHNRLERAGVSLAARYIACTELAGDFYDYVEDGDGAVALVIADVAGHGASAAMMTGVVKAAFRSSHVDGFEPLAVIGRIREGISDLDPGRFVTAFCARLDARRRELTYVNAGHPEPIVRTASPRPVLLDATGPILSSALADLPCDRATLALEPGDSLLLYTDGVTEASGPAGMFGRGRLVDVLTRDDRRGPELLDGLLALMTAFTGSASYGDDVTMLALTSPAREAAPEELPRWLSRKSPGGRVRDMGILSNDSPSDAGRLVARLHAGDRSALAVLFDAYRDRLHRMVDLRLDPRLRSRLDPADVVQDAFLDAAKRLDDYLHDSKVPPFLWLRLVVGERMLTLHRHHLGAKMRDAGREVSLYHEALPQASSAALASMLLGKFTSPTQAAQRAERLLRVQEALGSLDPVDREILSLRHFEQLNRAEAAQALGITEEAGAKRYIRALKRIKDVMARMPGGLEGL